MATAAARVARPKGVSDPARARPTTSRTLSFVVSMTSAGRSSKVRPDAHAPSSEDTGTRTLILYDRGTGSASESVSGHRAVPDIRGGRRRVSPLRTASVVVVRRLLQRPVRSDVVL